MDRLFGVILLLLILASVGMYAITPRDSADRPRVYWVTDPSPIHYQTVENFEKWLVANGHTAPDGGPLFDLRIDATNIDVTKRIIQGVSGVSGDIIDLADGQDVRYLNAVGLLLDLTDEAKRRGFTPDKTYAVFEPEIMVDGRQYAYPAQNYAYVLLVNADTFKRVGMDVPPSRWTWEEFERIGKEFVARTNPRKGRRTSFFANEIRPLVLWRSLGLSIFNETMTRSTLDDERYVRVLKMLHRWTYEDHLVPSAADLASIATQFQTQFGDSRMELFRSGNYAMIGMGRHAMPYFRRHEPVNIAISEPPHGEFPNTFAGARCVGIYAGSKHPELAMLFVQYMTSEQYNMGMVLDSDGIPPQPGYTQGEAYRRPPDHPNEWGVHGPAAQALDDIAIGGAYSPFCLPINAYGMEIRAREGYMAGLHSAEEAARLAAELINEEITRTLEDQPSLRPRYDQLVALQQKIDEHRAAGKKVPLEWISNPVLRKYYLFKGWAADDTEATR